MLGTSAAGLLEPHLQLYEQALRGEPGGLLVSRDTNILAPTGAAQTGFGNLSCSWPSSPRIRLQDSAGCQIGRRDDIALLIYT